MYTIDTIITFYHLLQPLTSVPLLLTVWQGLCASTQLRVLVSSVSVLLASLEMEDTLEVVVRVRNAI